MIPTPIKIISKIIAEITAAYVIINMLATEAQKSFSVLPLIINWCSSNCIFI